MKYITQVSMVLLAVCALNCGGDEGTTPENNESTPGEAQRCRLQSSVEETGLFEKPASDMHEYSEIFSHLEDDAPGWVSSKVSVFTPSPRMHPDPTYTESYLYEGEDAIFRHGLVWRGATEGHYRIYALVNFRSVPFGLVEATDDDSFPTDEEMIAHRERADYYDFELLDGKKYGMSFIISSEAFALGQVNEVRFLFIESGLFSPDDLYPWAGRVLSWNLGNWVHYGGSAPADFDCIGHSKFEPSPLRSQLLSRGGVMEVPGKSTSAFDEWDEKSAIPDVRELIAVEDASTTVHTSIAGDASRSRTYFAVRHNLLNGEFVPLGLVEDLPQYTPWAIQWPWARTDIAVWFPQTIELAPGEEGAFVTLFYSGAFDVEELFEFVAVSTNVLWLKRE